MGLRSISDIRRKELIEAAYRLLVTDGLQSLTVEKVARAAGASKGIIHHYFRDKTELIESALAYLSTFPGGVTEGRLKRASTPSQRIWAIASSNLRPEIFQPSVCRAWLELCSDTSAYPAARKRTREYYTMQEKEFLTAFRELLDEESAAHAAVEIISLIDGMWMRNSIRSTTLGSEWALNVIRDFLRHRCPRFDMSVTNDPES